MGPRADTGSCRWKRSKPAEISPRIPRPPRIRHPAADRGTMKRAASSNRYPSGVERSALAHPGFLNVGSFLAKSKPYWFGVYLQLPRPQRKFYSSRFKIHLNDDGFRSTFWRSGTKARRSRSRGDKRQVVHGRKSVLPSRSFRVRVRLS